MQDTINDGPMEPIDSEILTDLYKNTVKNLTEADLKKGISPEEVAKLKKFFSKISI